MNTDELAKQLNNVIMDQDEHFNIYDDVRDDIQSLVTAVSNVISEHPLLREKNFSLHYQHGRLGYMDLDMFAERIKIAEEQKDIDKSEN